MAEEQGTDQVPSEDLGKTPSKTRSVTILLSILLAVLAYTQLGLYSIQPIGAVPEGQTWVVHRTGDEPFFNSADAMSLSRTGEVSLLTRAIALAQAPKDRVLLRLPFWRTAYAQSVDGREFDR